MEVQLTIFTPTYNRAYILGQLYESLCRQTKTAFEWLIVDDGSTDNTQELVEKWQSEQKINIRYIWQENGGKMRAHNRGVQNCQTELFFCVDSDDYLALNSVELIYKEWEQVAENDEIAGIVAYRGFVNSAQLIKSQFSTDKQFSSLRNLYKSGFHGDTSLIFRTEILRQYLFPEIEGEKFITEAYIYNQIDAHYQLTLLPQPLIMCQYLPDGYTQNEQRLFRQNPKGWALYFNQRSRYCTCRKEKIVIVAKYDCFSMMSKNCQFICKANYPLLAFFCLPLAFYYKIKRYKKRK